MTKKYRIKLAVGLLSVAAIGLTAPARASEIDELKATIQSMQKSMEQMQTRITELERENHSQKHTATSRTARTAPAATSEGPSPAPPSDQTVTIAPTTVTIQGRASQIRGSSRIGRSAGSRSQA